MKLYLKYTGLLLCLCLCSIHNTKAQGVIVTIAGNGITQYIGEGSPADSFSLALPKSIYINKKGKLYIADNADSRIMTLYRDTLKTFIWGTAMSDSGDGGPANAATLRNPDGVCLDTAGNIYITEWYNDIIRKVDANTGIITTICGIAGGGYSGDGGPATAALLSSPGGACTDLAGNIYIPDYGNHRIRKINKATNEINTIAGTGVNSYTGDNGPATDATLSYPNSIYADSAGNLYFSEMGSSTIRRIDAATGIITTVAGTGTQGYSGDGNLAIHAQLAEPNGVFIDKQGYIYISDYNNNVIRAIKPDGYIYTIAGNGLYGYTGDGGSPLSATFRGPTAVTVDDSGYIYIADGFNSVIRKISPVGILNVAVPEVTKPSFDIYPNPSTGKFTITTGVQTSDAEVRVFNITGQAVFSAPFIGKSINIDLSGYSSGMYFVQFTAAKGQAIQKVIIR